MSTEIERLLIQKKQSQENVSDLHHYEEKIVMLTNEIERLNFSRSKEDK